MHFWRIPPTSHNGLLARAAPGTHEAVGELIQKHSIQGEKALDLAAGTGALISRLQSHGIKNFTAIEQDAENFGLPNVRLLNLDLNTDFAAKIDARFDVITAVEIIEHLDSPRHFLQQIHRLLEPKGVAVITTPNVAHWLGRLQFLLTGVPKYFTLKDFQEQRHISPIFDHHMRIMIDETDFTLVDYLCTASSWGLGIRMLTFPVRFMFRILCGPSVDGNVHVYLIRKNITPRSDS